MSDQQAAGDPGSRGFFARSVFPLAFASVVITLLVLVSPVGIGSGSDMIGYSIYRLLVFVLVQFPLAVLGIAGSVVAWYGGRPSWSGLVFHLLIITSTFFFYFAQARTICRVLSC